MDDGKPGTGGVIYNGVNYAWNWNDAYTEEVTETGGGKGDAMTPVAGETYYLKEVPVYYLDNYYHGTYVKTGEQKLISLYLISAIDDCNYNDTGFVLTKNQNGKNQTAIVSSALNFKETATGRITTLTPDSVFSDIQTGANPSYLTYWKATGADYFAANTSYSVQPYWITPDTITIKGTHRRTITIGTLTLSGISHD